MPSTARTFIALPIPDLQRTRLGRLQGLIAPELPNARWVTPDQFHLTLAFLGDIPDLDMAAVCRGVAEAALKFGPLTLNLQSLGAFPDATNARVAWVGVTGPNLDLLMALRLAVVEGVTRAGYPPEDDRFTPHLTLGRLKVVKGQPIDLSPQIAHFRTWSAGNFEVNQVISYASTITPEGPSYMALATAPLRGAKDRSGA